MYCALHVCGCRYNLALTSAATFDERLALKLQLCQVLASGCYCLGPHTANLFQASTYIITVHPLNPLQAVEKRINSYLEQGRRVLLVGDLNIRRLPIDSKGTVGTEEESATWWVK
jgi:hypothetical protein